MNGEELLTRIDTATDTVEALTTEAKAGGHHQAVLALTIAHCNLLAASCFVEGKARLDDVVDLLTPDPEPDPEPEPDPDAPVPYRLISEALNARFGDPTLSRLDRMDGRR